jgi:hypothetical protein
MRASTLAFMLVAASLAIAMNARVRADNAGFALAPKSSSIAIDARGLSALLAAGNASSIRPVLEAVAGRDAVVTFDALSRRCNEGADTIAHDVFSGRVAFSLSTVEIADAVKLARQGEVRVETQTVWMFGIEADNMRCERALTLLGAKFRSPGWFDAAAEHLIIRRASGWLLIAPMPHGEALLEAASKRIAVEDASVSLLGEPLMQQLLVSDAPVRMFVRHEHPIGGATCVGIRARTEGGTRGLRAEIDGVYDSAPIGRQGGEAALDPHVVKAFEDRAVMVLSNPCTGALSKGDGYWLALLPELASAPAMRANLSGERVMLVGQCSKHVMPAMAVAWRVEDAEQAKGDQEHFMQGIMCGLTRANDVKGDAKNDVTSDVKSDVKAAAPALGQFFDRYLGKPFKLSDAVLCWETVATPCGGWQVYANDPEWLTDVSARLTTSSCIEGERPNACGLGFCDGPRAATLLRRWRPFASDTAPADMHNRVLHGIHAIANMMEQLGRVRFEYHAPCAGCIHAVIDFEPLGTLEPWRENLEPSRETFDRAAGVR